MSTEVTLAYVDDFLPEDEPLLAARRNAAEVGGAAPVDPVTGAALRFAAAAIGARAVVEIGTGCGASGLWLLRGMRPGAVLTSVDVEPEHQRLATAALRLLRAGGVVIFDNALSRGRVADLTCSDPDAVAVRELCELVKVDERLVPLLLPIGDGLLAAVRRPE